MIWVQCLLQYSGICTLIRQLSKIIQLILDFGKMKHIIILAVLAAVAAVASGAVIQPTAVARSNLNAGYIAAGDRLLYSNYFYKQAYPNAIQSQDIIYRGARTTVVTAVYATEVGYTQYANAYIVAGGIGRNNVTVRLMSARGYGYYYQVDIWGR